MARPKAFRGWFYIRTGYTVYFNFVFASINMMTVTYYLAIENLPFLKEIFPNFTDYVIILVGIGIPILLFTGWLHFRRSTAYKSEAEISFESNPYLYKLPPGYWINAVMPFYLQTSKILVKISKKEEITEKELKEIDDLEKTMEHLLKGGYVGEYRHKD